MYIEIMYELLCDSAWLELKKQYMMINQGTISQYLSLHQYSSVSLKKLSELNLQNNSVSIFMEAASDWRTGRNELFAHPGLVDWRGEGEGYFQKGLNDGEG